MPNTSPTLLDSSTSIKANNVSPKKSNKFLAKNLHTKDKTIFNLENS